MITQNDAENIVAAHPAPEPHLQRKLGRIVELVRQRHGCDVVIDFSNVDIMTSASVTSLIRLQKLADDRGQRLVLWGIRAVTKGVLEVMGLGNAVDMCDDLSEALAWLRGTASR